MTTFRTFLGIVNVHTVVVLVLALASTHAARTFGLSAEMPAEIVSVAVIFPIVFSIHAAYVRREEALRALASLRSNATGLYYAHRDWIPARGPSEHTRRARERIVECFEAVQAFLRQPADERTGLMAVYGCFSDLSSSLEGLRDAGVSTSELGRANQYLRAMIMDFEILRNIATYRTPVPLRAYSHVFLNAFPILFGPYFASLSVSYYPIMGYAVAALYSVVLVSLDNIQGQLENPFDAVGVDDIRFDEQPFVEAALSPEAIRAEMA